MPPDVDAGPSAGRQCYLTNFVGAARLFLFRISFFSSRTLPLALPDLVGDQDLGLCLHSELVGMNIVNEKVHTYESMASSSCDSFADSPSCPVRTACFTLKYRRGPSCLPNSSDVAHAHPRRILVWRTSTTPFTGRTGTID